MRFSEEVEVIPEVVVIYVSSSEEEAEEAMAAAAVEAVEAEEGGRGHGAAACARPICHAVAGARVGAHDGGAGGGLPSNHVRQ